MKAIKIFHLFVKQRERERRNFWAEGRALVARNETPALRLSAAVPLITSGLPQPSLAAASGWQVTSSVASDCCHRPPGFLRSRQCSREELRLTMSPTQSQLGMTGRCHLCSLREPQCWPHRKLPSMACVLTAHPGQPHRGLQVWNREARVLSPLSPVSPRGVFKGS